MIVVGCWITIIVYGEVSAFGVTTWLAFMYWLSYIKVFITLVKYIPQVYLNWRRKSTVGWSIWNVLLDFTGGVFSFLQLFVNALDEGEQRLLLPSLLLHINAALYYPMAHWSCL